MKPYFYGYYHKLQNGKDTIAFIPGRFAQGEFIQVITGSSSYYVPYIKNNRFTSKGLCLNISEPFLSVKGRVEYLNFTPIKYDIMGPFKFSQMECRHTIVSMRHNLRGSLNINGVEYNFTDGVGYIEGDSGTSFPKSYFWIQSNDFTEKASIMASVADIPFCGMHFKGCICVVFFDSKEYRLATYLGVKILVCNENQLILKQGKYLLQIDISNNSGQKLFAPSNGKMTRTIHESPCCTARFRFHQNSKLLFDMTSHNTSLEVVLPNN